ncbi:pentapeptide repeat-containing protein [Thalassospira sp.]|uniref:pentapeptide repeat-containing protein n=1 Tax=Thalassospira sp. TaxID=1912094 RepID=UPI0025D1BC4A|nr:pentapeptide repeat-containing protein [Thalassospira sp.]
MASHDNKKKTILYADYSERNITAARAAVEPLGFGKFIDCDDRERTVEMVSELKPDLVLIGLYLDGIRGISTIRAIRDSATDDNPHGREVPILLGAPKLDRRGMRDAVDAGIEGVFRQPVDPERLAKIIEAVLKKPRRFVFEENYFGPARPQDLAKMAGSKPAKKPTASATPAAADNPTSKAQPETPAVEVPESATIAKTPENDGAGPITRTRTPKASPAVGMTTNLDLADAKPRLNGTGQTFGDGELVGAPSAGDKKTGKQNLEAVQSAREALSPATARSEDKPSDTPDEEIEAEEDIEVEDEELVEIDLQEALISHKLWVDTGGREGTVMSIEHADLRDAELEGIDLSRCGLPFASFQRANCKDAVLRRCNLIAADFVESNLDNANLAASRLTGARFNKAMVRNTVFLGSDLSNANFRGLQMINCDLSGTNLSGADFRDADLSCTRGLFAEQIQRARVNANTRLPRDLKLRG